MLSGSDCWCVDQGDVDWNSPIPTTNCSTPCAGNTGQACGELGIYGTVHKIGNVLSFACLCNHVHII